MSKKKTNQQKKKLGIGKKLGAIMLLSCSLVGLGVLIGFSVWDVISLIFAVPVCVLAFAMLLILLKDYDRNKKEKTTKWYVDKILAALVPVWVISAITIIALGYEEDDVIFAAGLLMFPLLSILISPNAVMYALKDMKDWKKIFYGKGNLESFKATNEFYPVKAPVPFEKKLFLAVFRDQILDLLTVITIMFVGSVVAIILLLSYDSYSVRPGDLLGAILYVRVRRETGFMFFIMIAIVVFGLPLVCYYITNSIYRFRIVSGHKYIAYHAIIWNMDGSIMRINRDKRQYKYEYCTLVGMRPKKVNNTPAVLIFIPDGVFIFPDEKSSTA